MMENIFFLILPLLLATCNGQYGTEEYDPVTGSLLGECTFYGDYTTDCSGRLTCRPTDVEDRPTTAFLDSTCPKETGIKSGKWDRDMSVIPSNQIARDVGSGRICKCQFYANRQQGNFKCTSVQGDTWKGQYTGSLNTAFRLGLSSSEHGTYRYVPDRDRTGTGSGATYRATGDDDSRYTPSYSRYTTGSPYDRVRGSSNDRDTYSGSRYPDSTRDRDTSYSRDNDLGTRDRYQTTYRGTDTYDRDRETRYPSRGTTSEVTMCTYHNDRKGSCRDCTERVERRETTTEIRTTKHYTCSGAEHKVTWPESSGIIPRGTQADPYAYTKKVVATCVFRPEEGRRYECHGSSTDGECATTGTFGSSGFGASSGTTGASQRCIGGEKWTGTYSGSIY